MAISLLRLTKNYLDAYKNAWDIIHIGDKEIKLTDAFIPLNLVALASSFNTREYSEKDKREDNERRKTAAQNLEKHQFNSIEKVLKDFNHLVLLGDAGSGKTTTMHFIGMMFLEQFFKLADVDLDHEEYRVPIFLELKTYGHFLAQPGARIEKTLVEEITQIIRCSKAEAEGLLDFWIKNNNLLVLLDGLDEINTSEKQIIIRDIQNFSVRPDMWKNRIIVTARSAGYSHLGRKFQEFTISPILYLGDLEDYVNKYLKILQGGNLTDFQIQEKSSLLVQHLQNHSSLKPITSNPLFLRLALQFFSLTGNVNIDLKQLFDSYFHEVWLGAVKRGLPEGDKHKNALEKTLEALAWHIHTGKSPDEKTCISEILRYSEQQEAEIMELFTNLKLASGILEFGQNRINFANTVLEEYFVARFLVRAWGKNPQATWHVVRPKLHLAKWQNSIKLMFTFISEREATQLIKDIKWAGSSFEFTLRRDLKLTANLLASGPNAHIEDKRKMVDFLYRFEIGRGRREKLVRIFLWSEYLLPYFLMYLKHLNLWVILIVGIIWSTFWTLLMSEYLEWVTNSRLPQFLKHAIRFPERFIIRDLPVYEVTELLTQIKTKKSLDLLIKISSSPDKLIAYAAKYSMAKNIEKIVEEPGVFLESIIENLRSGSVDIDSNVANILIEKLGQLASPQAVRVLELLLNNPSWQKEVMKALAQIGTQEALEIINRNLESNNNTFLGHEVINALALQKSKRSIRGLFYFLTHGHYSIQDAASNALAELGTYEVTSEAGRLLRAKDYHVRKRAAELLERIDSQDAIKLLEIGVSDEDYDIRLITMRKLRILDEHKFIKNLSSLIGQIKEKPYLLASAIASLDKPIEIEDGIDELIQASKSSDKWGYLSPLPLQALGKIQSPKAINRIIECLDDKDEFIRQNAVTALGTLGIYNKNDLSRITALLISKLADDTSPVRQAAISSLGKIGTQEAIEAIKRTLVDLLNKPIEPEQDKTNTGTLDSILQADGGTNKFFSEEVYHTLSFLSLFHDTNPTRTLIENSIKALVESDDKSANRYNVLFIAVNHPDPEIRAATIEAISKIDLPGTFNVLLKCLNDQETSVKNTAVRALGNIGSPRAVQALISVLNDDNVYRNVKLTLQSIGSSDVIKGLTAHLKNSDRVLRKRAVSILGDIGETESIPELARVMESDRVLEVRNEAYDALIKQISNIEDVHLVRKLRNAAWWKLTDTPPFENVGYYLEDFRGCVLRYEELTEKNAQENPYDLTVSRITKFMQLGLRLFLWGLLLGFAGVLSVFAAASSDLLKPFVLLILQPYSILILLGIVFFISLLAGLVSFILDYLKPKSK